MQILENVLDHLTEWFVLYLAVIFLFICLVLIGSAGLDAKKEYVTLCVQTGKTESYCEMRWIEINHCASYE